MRALVLWGAFLVACGSASTPNTQATNTQPTGPSTPEKPRQLNESCGSVACDSGLECVANSFEPHLGGTCLSEVSTRVPCGINTTIPMVCPGGLTCVLLNGQPSQSGGCHFVSQAGEACDGNADFYAVCAPGLTCRGPSVPVSADYGGNCQ